MLLGNFLCALLGLDGLNRLKSQRKSRSSIKRTFFGFSGGAGTGYDSLLNDALQIIVAVVGAPVILNGWLWNDMRGMEARTRQEMRGNRQEIRELRTEMHKEFLAMRIEISQEFRELRTEVRREIRKMSRSIAYVQERMAALEAVTDVIRVGLQLRKVGVETRPPPAE